MDDGDNPYSEYEQYDNETPYNDHQGYDTYEEEFYGDAYWAGRAEETRGSSEGPSQLRDQSPTNENEVTDVHFIASPTIECRNCHHIFGSRNKLHNHIRAGCTKRTKMISMFSCAPKQDNMPREIDPERTGRTPSNARVEALESIIESDATDEVKGGCGFRGWQYVTAMIKLQATTTATAEPVCLDTGCTMSIIDREFLRLQAPETKIQQMASPITIRGVGQGTYRCNEFARLDIYLQGSPTALIHRDVHIVDGLKAKMLIGVDIIGSERIIIDVPRRIVIVGSCRNVKIPITVAPRAERRIKQQIKANNDVVVPPHAHLMIPIQQPELPPDRDLLFEPLEHVKGVAVYTHIVDCNMTAVQARNDTNTSVVLRKDTLLGTVVEYEVEGCYMADPDIAIFAAAGPNSKTMRARPSQSNPTGDVLATISATDIIDRTSSSLIANPTPTVPITPTSTIPETQLDNGVTIYGDDLRDFQEVVKRYPNLWVDNGSVVDVPEYLWMEIPLLENWRELYNGKQASIYPLGPKDRKEVDKLFDKLQSEGRMEWTTCSTPFCYPFFVVWKTINGQPKGRVVVNIRALNKITSQDTYPVPS